MPDKFDFKSISVDRLDNETKTQLQYAYLKSTIYDKRLIVYKDCDFLTEEILGLERESDGHIQHPAQGTQGSKDAIDAVCGALWNANLHADEYAYDFGEDLELFMQFENDATMQNYTREQFLKEFKESLGAMQATNQFKAGNSVYYDDLVGDDWVII